MLQSLVGRCCKKGSEWCLLSADVHIHRDSAMHKHCLKELYPIASACLMQQPPRCSETFLNDTSPGCYATKGLEFHREKGRSVKNSRRVEK